MARMKPRQPWWIRFAGIETTVAVILAIVVIGELVYRPNGPPEWVWGAAVVLGVVAGFSADYLLQRKRQGQ